MPQARNPIMWRFFKILEGNPDVAQCTKCNHQLKATGSSTTGFARHFTNAHSEDWFVFQEEQLSLKRKRDEGLPQLKNIYNENDEFEEAWGGQTLCVLGISVKK